MFSAQNLTAGKIYHGWVMENGEKLDEVILLPFKSLTATYIIYSGFSLK